MIEVLLSVMNQSDLEITKQVNVQTNCLIINQSDKESYIEEDCSFGKIRMITCQERGLSKSRNRALTNSSADICILCDDDVRYVDDYEKIVLEAFNSLPDADVIVFNIEQVNSVFPSERIINRIYRIPSFMAFGSVRIAFRRKSIVDNGIKFNEMFGAGSGLFSMAEDSLLFRSIHKCELKAYAYPKTIAQVDFSSSTWFSGFNKKYYYDTGAFLSAAYPLLKYLLMFYFPIRTRRMSSLHTLEILACIVKGFRGYRRRIPYE